VKGFFNISKTLTGVAEKVCGGRIVLMPGSGYNPAVLPLCWYALSAGVVGLERIDVTDPYPSPGESSYTRPKVEETLAALKKLLKPHWECFR